MPMYWWQQLNPLCLFVCFLHSCCAVISSTHTFLHTNYLFRFRACLSLTVQQQAGKHLDYTLHAYDCCGGSLHWFMMSYCTGRCIALAWGLCLGPPSQRRVNLESCSGRPACMNHDLLQLQCQQFWASPLPVLTQHGVTTCCLSKTRSGWRPAAKWKW